MRLRDIKIGGWYKVVDAFGGTKKAEVIGLIPGERALISVRYERSRNAVPKRPNEVVEPWVKEEACQIKVKAHKEGKQPKPVHDVKVDIMTVLDYLKRGFVSDEVGKAMIRLRYYAG